MEKTVQNIKKFLHISPKKKKSDTENKENVNGFSGTVEERTVTTKIEISQPVEPLYEDVEDADFDGDRCEACR